MTLSDFTSDAALSFRKHFNLDELANSTHGICATSLSIWNPHVRHKRDRHAYRDLFRHVDFLAVSSALDELEHLDVVKHIAMSQNLLPAEEPHKFDCSTELLGEKSHYPGDEVEVLDAFARPSVASLLMLSRNTHTEKSE